MSELWRESTEEDVTRYLASIDHHHLCRVRQHNVTGLRQRVFEAESKADSLNVVFKLQLQAFKALLQSCPPEPSQARDMDFLLALGELFTLIVYGQLILEAARLQNVDDRLLDQIFDVLIRDFSRHALALHVTGSTTPDQAARCLEMIRRPDRDPGRFDRVWTDHVLATVDAYEMTP